MIHNLGLIESVWTSLRRSVRYCPITVYMAWNGGVDMAWYIARNGDELASDSKLLV